MRKLRHQYACLGVNRVTVNKAVLHSAANADNKSAYSLIADKEICPVADNGTRNVIVTAVGGKRTDFINALRTDERIGIAAYFKRRMCTHGFVKYYIFR